MKKILFVICFAFIPAQSFAVDPNNWMLYLQNLLAVMQVEGYDRIDEMYDQRFIQNTVDPSTTINKTHVYYDPAKVLFELRQLTWDRAGFTAAEEAILNKIPDYIAKAKEITSQYYIRSAAGGGGFMAFPHGLEYCYRLTCDAEALEGLRGLRNKGAWVTGQFAGREHQVFSRGVAYTLQIGIAASKLDVSYTTSMSHDDIMTYYANLAKSHLTQWSTGNFYDYKDYSFYRQTFMTGLTMAALIEYYERVYADPEIPPLIKSTIDDAWALVWHDDVTNPSPQTLGDAQSYAGMYPEGAFWYMTDWVTDHYEIDHNNLPNAREVNATSSSMQAVAFAWYGWHADDSLYIERAEKIFDGIAFNREPYSPEGQTWESMKYIFEFIKYYRAYHKTPCANATIEQCYTQSACEGTGGNWSGEWCQHDPVLYANGSCIPQKPKRLRITK